MAKPATPEVETVVPAVLDQLDPADLPLVERRGHVHTRRVALASIGSQVALGIDVRGEVLPREVDRIVAELLAMRDAAFIEQRRQDVSDERAAEVEALAALEDEELLAMRSSAERIGDAGSVLLYSDALELRATYRDEAKVEHALAGRDA